jgi:hypothetical protein
MMFSFSLSEEITLRRAIAQCDALVELSRAVTGAGLRCLVVERVRLVVTRSWGPRGYLPPYLEVRDGARLVVTISVSERAGRRPFYVVTLPGGLQVRMGEVGDAESTAGYVRQMPGLLDGVEDGRGAR